MTTLTSTVATVCLPRAASTGSPARAPLPASARDLVASARRSLTEAVIASTPCERYAAAHLAALRAAAAVPKTWRRSMTKMWCALWRLSWCRS